MSWGRLVHSDKAWQHSSSKLRLPHQPRARRNFLSPWLPTEVCWRDYLLKGSFVEQNCNKMLFSGLCGACHTGVSRYIRNDLNAREGPDSTKIVCVGDKSRTVLQRTHGDRFIISANEVSFCDERCCGSWDHYKWNRIDSFFFFFKLIKFVNLFTFFSLNKAIIFFHIFSSVAFHQHSVMPAVWPTRFSTLATTTLTATSSTTSSRALSHTNAPLCQFTA